MNYTNLKQSIQDYLENDETTFVNELDNIIKLAEEKIHRAVLLPNFRKNQYTTLTSSNEYLSLPSDWLATHSLAVDNSGFSFLILKDVNFIRSVYPSSTTTGVPKYYALFDSDTFILGPTPDSNYTVQLHYYYEPTSIVSASTTWLGDNAENALLYGCLIEGYRFMKGDQDMFAEYKQNYDTAISDLKILAHGLDRRDDYRHGVLALQ
jgi:hypothetical protein